MTNSAFTYIIIANNAVKKLTRQTRIIYGENTMRYLLLRLLTGERLKKLNRHCTLLKALRAAVCVLSLACTYFCPAFEGAARVALSSVFGFFAVAAAGAAAYFGISYGYLACKLLNAERQDTDGGTKDELILKVCSFYAGKTGRKIIALNAAAAFLFTGANVTAFCFSIGAGLSYVVAVAVIAAADGAALALLLAATYFETDASALPGETYTAFEYVPRTAAPARSFVLSHQEKFLSDGRDVQEYRKLVTDEMFTLTLTIALSAAFSLALCMGAQSADERAFAPVLALDILNIFFIIAAVAIHFEILKRAVYARNAKLLALRGDGIRSELQRIYEKFQRVTNAEFAIVAAVGTLAGFFIGFFGTEDRSAYAALCGGGMAAGIFFFISALVGLIIYTVLYVRYDKKVIPLEASAETVNVSDTEDGV